MGEAGSRSAAADEVNDLDDVARSYRVHRVPSARHDRSIDLDRDRSVRKAQVLDERADRQPLRHLAGSTVDRDFHGATD